MRTELEIDSDKPGKLSRAITPSLDSSERVDYKIVKQEEKIEIIIETDSLGSLRGTTDAAFRLALLSKKILR